jgi:thiol-disulfide isomerase/thioredoxin
MMRHMRRLLSRSLLLLFLGLTLCASRAQAQQTRIIHFPELQRMMTAQNDTTYVFNFFATWCEPCVKEFPNFQKLADDNQDKAFKLVFVSLDFKKAFKNKLLPFLKKRQVTEQTVLLDEPDYNSWIDKVSKDWDGNLPMTLVINNARHVRQVYAHDFTYDSLRTTIEPFLR